MMRMYFQQPARAEGGGSTAVETCGTTLRRKSVTFDMYDFSLRRIRRQLNIKGST
jgi:hypothetical protein